MQKTQSRTFTFFQASLLASYKTVNLVTNIVGWSWRMLSIKRKSLVIYYVLTLQIFGTLKILHFWQNYKKLLNWLNSASWVSYAKVVGSDLAQESYTEVTYKGHVNYPKHSEFTKGRSYKNADFLSQLYESVSSKTKSYWMI